MQPPSVLNLWKERMGRLVFRALLLVLFLAVGLHGLEADPAALGPDPVTGATPWAIDIYVKSDDAEGTVVQRQVPDPKLAGQFAEAIAQAPVKKFKWFGNSARKRWYVLRAKSGATLRILEELDFLSPAITLLPMDPRFGVANPTPLPVPDGGELLLPPKLIKAISRAAGLPELSP